VTARLGTGLAQEAGLPQLQKESAARRATRRRRARELGSVADDSARARARRIRTLASRRRCGPPRRRARGALGRPADGGYGCGFGADGPQVLRHTVGLLERGTTGDCCRRAGLRQACRRVACRCRVQGDQRAIGSERDRRRSRAMRCRRDRLGPRTGPASMDPDATRPPGSASDLARCHCGVNQARRAVASVRARASTSST
jgi:hypothetical protein